MKMDLNQKISFINTGYLHLLCVYEMMQRTMPQQMHYVNEAKGQMSI